jgi:hypothetical protein
LGHCAASRKVTVQFPRDLVKGDRCVRLITLPPSWADCLAILEASVSCSRKVLCRPVTGELLPYLYLYLYIIDKQFQKVLYTNVTLIVNNVEFKRFVEEINILPVTGFEPQFPHPVT